METMFVYSREQAIEDGILMKFDSFFIKEQREMTHRQKVDLSVSIGKIKSEGRQQRFPLGELIITTNAAGKLDALEAITFLYRHQTGDWGSLCDVDWQLNDDALHYGSRVFSVYEASDRNGDRLEVYVITEWNREATTILLPEDY